MAMEGACFVLVCIQVLTGASREKTKLTASPFVKTTGGGCAIIFGPDGAPLVEPLDLFLGQPRPLIMSKSLSIV